MEYNVYSHLLALDIIKGNQTYSDIFETIFDTIREISENNIISQFNLVGQNSKSISKALTLLIEKGLLSNGWKAEQPIFKDNISVVDSILGKRWTHDFYLNSVSLEIAFNHEEGSVWNLSKSLISYLPNDKVKNCDVRIGVIICVTNNMRQKGGFDNSIGTFEKYIQYLKLMRSIFTMPVLLIGINAPENFVIKPCRFPNKTIGQIKNI